MQLDNSTLQSNIFLSRPNESFSLRDFLCLLKKDLRREELIYLTRELSQELSERNSMIFETIPGKHKNFQESHLQIVKIRTSIAIICNRWLK